MNIIEATRKAIECDGYIVRLYGGATWASAMKPTNSHDCYILHSTIQPGRLARCWSPTADDILRDDWEVITTKDFLYKTKKPQHLSDRSQNVFHKEQ